MMMDKKNQNEFDSKTIKISHSSQNAISNKSIITEKKNIINKEFIYSTPVLNKRRNIYIPSTPKKIQETNKFDNLIIRGKNLTKLFESM